MKVPVNNSCTNRAYKGLIVTGTPENMLLQTTVICRSGLDGAIRDALESWFVLGRPVRGFRW
jgi:hypothetical protein